VIANMRKTANSNKKVGILYDKQGKEFWDISYFKQEFGRFINFLGGWRK